MVTKICGLGNGRICRGMVTYIYTWSTRGRLGKLKAPSRIDIVDILLYPKGATTASAIVFVVTSCQIQHKLSTFATVSRAKPGEARGHYGRTDRFLFSVWLGGQRRLEYLMPTTRSKQWTDEGLVEYKLLDRPAV